MDVFRLKPGHRLHWDRFDPDATGPFKHKDEVEDETQKLLSDIDDLQDRLYAQGKQALLIVLQAMDTGGKDGTIRHVMKGVNPQSCRVTSFKVPTTEEAAHDFLWRLHKEVPPKGYIGIFNRSHYEDVLVTRVHQLISDKEARHRFNRINDFEKLLTQSGTTVLKFYLGISKGEQRQRLEKRLEHPDKNWKFSAGDLVERKHWMHYQNYYAQAIEATNKPHAPWHLIPANHKWYRNYEVARIIVKALRAINPVYPPAPKGLKMHEIKIR